jgi:DNA modification methylase
MDDADWTMTRPVRNQVLPGDVLERLKKLPKESVQVVVTSPPYFGLRSYLPADNPDKAKEVGLEQTPHEFVAKLVEVFREVHRVLRPDGVLFLNLGDTYANDAKWGGSTGGKHATALHGNTSVGRGKKHTGFKAKDLIGIPWRVALALQDDGWWLRNDVIWAKGNPMPEAVQDRFTRSHEYIFMLTKSQDYFFDADAVREPAGDWVNDDPRYQEGAEEQERDLAEPSRHVFPGKPITGLTRKPITNRNKRTVWAINNLPYRGAHFATMPEEIPRICIKAASSEKGACPTCGAPWGRIIERGESHYAEVKGDRHWTDLQADAEKKGWVTRGGPTLDENGTMPSLYAAPRRELGWKPTCEHPEHDPVPCVVLDPFAGSGTTLAVAKMLGRDYVGIELNPNYLPLIEERVRKPTEWQAERGIFELMMGLGED